MEKIGATNWHKNDEMDQENDRTERGKLDLVVMGQIRAKLVPELKTYIDLSKPKNPPQFEALIHQWVASQP